MRELYLEIVKCLREFLISIYKEVICLVKGKNE